MGVVQKNKGGKSLRMNNLPQRILRPVREPSPDGNRRERRAYEAMRREAEQTNRTSDALKLLLSGEAQMAWYCPCCRATDWHQFPDDCDLGPAERRRRRAYAAQQKQDK